MTGITRIREPDAADAQRQIEAHLRAPETEPRARAKTGPSGRFVVAEEAFANASELARGELGVDEGLVVELHCDRDRIGGGIDGDAFREKEVRAFGAESALAGCPRPGTQETGLEGDLTARTGGDGGAGRGCGEASEDDQSEQAET